MDDTLGAVALVHTPGEEFETLVKANPTKIPGGDKLITIRVRSIHFWRIYTQCVVT